MNLAISSIAELVVFALVVGLVLFASRRLDAAATVRRRMNPEASAPVAPADSIVRQQGARNPLLAWVQTQALTNPEERQQLARDLADAGFPSPAAPALYVVIRLGMAIGLPVGFLFAQSILLPHPFAGLQLIVIALVLCGASMILPRAFIDNRAGARRDQLEREFPDALDLMVVCVEAGLALEAAFIRVGDETAESHPRISAEFRQVSQELRAGRSRAEALRGMADRSKIDVVKSFVALLIQTDALGVSIAQSLRIYSQELRQHRILRAEEKAMRIPVLLTIPLVACILPVVVGSVMLPVIIDLVRTVIPALTHVGGQ